jgi:hypothetical protein
VVVAFVLGELKPGDPFPEPSELAGTCNMPCHEVLAAINCLLASRLLEQNRSGALRIRRGATPTVEMKQHAFVCSARQLVDHARRWQLPADSLDQLFQQAAREKPCCNGIRQLPPARPSAPPRFRRKTGTSGCNKPPLFLNP